MAIRKQFATTPIVSENLKRLLEEARTTVVSEEQLSAQSVSFAYGNAPKSDLITKESVALASKRFRLNAA